MKRNVMALAAALLVLAALMSGCEKDTRFEDAALLMQQGNYEAALTVFETLAAEGYEGADAQAMECRYQLALKVQESGELAATEQAMLALGGYKDSAEIAAACRAELDRIAAYEDAKLLMQSEPAKARDALLALGDFRDSALLAEICLNYMGYPILYEGVTYDVKPIMLGKDEDGNVTLTVSLSDVIKLSFGEGEGQIVLTIPPASISVYVGGQEIVYRECEFVDDHNCIYKFDTQGPAEKVEIYSNLGGSDGERHEVDPTTLVLIP